MENELMFVVRSQYDKYTHRVGNIDTLKDLLLALSGDAALAKRIGSIAKKMQAGDGFATHGVMLTVERLIF